MQQLNIGICGAGIGGLTAAAALAQDGHRVTVYDQFERPGPVGSGLIIQPVGQEVLRQIGADKIAFDLGQPIHRMIGHEVIQGRRVLDVSYATPKRARFGLGLHRSALFHAVHQAALASGAVLEAGHKASGITEGPERQIQFHGKRQSPAFDLVIDASGAGSPMSPLDAEPLPYGAIWGTVDWPSNTELPDTQLSQTYRAAHRMAGVLPTGYMHSENRPKASIFWSLTRDDYVAWRNAPIEKWKKEATTMWPEMAPFLERITERKQMKAAFYSHGTLADPVAPGLVHIGDAAHRASPQLGQGANMAMLDATALAKALRDGDDLDDALATYAKMRQRHLKLYQAFSAAFTPLYQSDRSFPASLRDKVLTPLSRIPPVPRLLSKLVCGDLVQPYPGWPGA